MAYFALAAIGFVWGAEIAKFLMPFAVLVEIGFFGITQIWSGSFLLFIAYEAAILLSVTILYGYSYFRYRSPGSGFLTLGTLIGILAAILDAQPSLHLKVYWELDEHGIFHLVQMLSLFLMAMGVYKRLASIKDTGPAVA
ncbi:MAG: hypothetical protein NTU79_08265 [Planctomycetota bacterium]|nr:hypothetical protein [Planctomycetota bacterium]